MSTPLSVGRRVGVVAEADVLEAHLAAHAARVELDGVGALGDVDRLVEVLEDPREERERRLHVEADVEQREAREQQARLQRGEGDDGADRDRAAAVGDALAGEPVDERRHDREAHLDRRHPPAAGHPRADLEVGQLDRLGLEAVGELGRAAHRLAEQDAADADSDSSTSERHVGQAALALGGDPLALVADPARDPRRRPAAGRARTRPGASRARSSRRSSRSPSSRSRRSRSPCSSRRSARRRCRWRSATAPRRCACA